MARCSARSHPAGWETATPPAISSARTGALLPGGEGSGTLEDELHFLYVAAKKVEQIREDLGSAGEVIAAQVEQKMLGKRTDWQTADVEIAGRAKRPELKINRDIARSLQKLTETLAESRTDLNLSPQTAERVVRTALRLAHNKDLIPAAAPDGFAGTCFRLPDLPGAWGQARNDGLYHPVTGQERPITFDDAAAAERTDVVLFHLGHRLVAMCLRLLRAELWSHATPVTHQRLSRVTARIVPAATLRTPAVIGHIRVVVTGAEGTRLHEEVILAGGTIEGGRLERSGEEQLKAWLAAATEDLPPAHILERLTGLWPSLVSPLAGTLSNRSAAKRRSLGKLLADRCEEEVAAMDAILTELDRSICAALDDTGYWYQASLFEIQSERDQLHKDREALISRLDSLPATRGQETAALRRRYEKPTARWFPAAVTFLVPATIAHSPT